MDQMTKKYVDGFMADLTAKNPGEKEFHQAVQEGKTNETRPHNMPRKT